MKMMYQLEYWVGKQRYTFVYNTRKEAEDKLKKTSAYRWDIRVLRLVA